MLLGVLAGVHPAAAVSEGRGQKRVAGVWRSREPSLLMTLRHLGALEIDVAIWN